MKDESNSNHSAVGRFDASLGAVTPLVTPNEGIWGVHPRNVSKALHWIHS